MIQCTECLAGNPDNANYCNHCGRRLFQPRTEAAPAALPPAPVLLPPAKPVVRKCSACLGENLPDASACIHCGQRFNAPASRPKSTDTPGTKILALFLGFGVFAVSVWAADWARIYPYMAMITVLGFMLIIFWAAKGYTPKPDFLNYAISFILMAFPPATPVVIYYAGLYLARQLNPR